MLKRKKKTMDGNTAAAHVSYAFTDVAAIYPITPSSPMADYTDIWSVQGRKNIFGSEVTLHELQSEAGAAGAMHGALQAGALSTTYTASQGLLLMIPNMYKMAGELLPAVINVSARAVATHALSIFGDHSDIYACRQTGFAMLASSNVQEIMDLGAAVHLSAIRSRVPFMHFFDGFRTSHEIQKIDVWDYEQLADMCDFEAIREFRERALNPMHPVQRGTAQNPDIFFQMREASNKHYEKVPEIVEEYLNTINKKLNTDYALFNYYGDPDAEHIIIAMGSVCDTIEETLDYISTHKPTDEPSPDLIHSAFNNYHPKKCGLVKVHLYRPFSIRHLLKAIPNTVKYISVLDRTKEPGSAGEPLYLDVLEAVKGPESNSEEYGFLKNVTVLRGRYGLGSKDTTPADILAVYSNTEKTEFTLGINDDVTGLSLKRSMQPDTAPFGTTSCKFWGLGSDGTVGANKNSIKIIGDNTDLNVQAYFDYDSKKSGGITISHLRFGNSPIKSSYLINKADFIACHNPVYMKKYDILSDLKPDGIFLLNCSQSPEELENFLPDNVKAYIAHNNIRFYIIDGIGIGRELGLGGRINTILQAAFFRLTEIIPEENAISYMKEAAKKSYGKKGDEVVNMNYRAIDAGFSQVNRVAVPEAWKKLEAKRFLPGKAPENIIDGKHYLSNIMIPINDRQGDELPVSAFMYEPDGTVPLGTSAIEKRGIAVDVPVWIPENCIQCSLCSYVCPHSVIRPVIWDPNADNDHSSANLVSFDGHPEHSMVKADELEGLPATALPGLNFAITVSVFDCTGCGCCAEVCPGRKEKALYMDRFEKHFDSQKAFNTGTKLETPQAALDKFKASSVKGSQLRKPLLEFSGACAGCGETPYAKLVTQLYGDRMYIANATGCSSIWGGSSPSTPYTKNSKGHGPAWANSLFEDNAEFGFGMLLAHNTMRSRLAEALRNIDNATNNSVIKSAINIYFDTFSSTTDNMKASDELLALLQEQYKALPADSAAASDYIFVLENKSFLAKKSQWLFGGDGWAYDIGYGGLDHVLASGLDINTLVFDTEVYSNTGGQASKATPLGAVAQFAAAGKSVRKKKLAEIAMTYGYVYVAQIAMGADYNQCVKAITEAESYPGPSLIIAYAPCINHGIKGGLANTPSEQKRAVEAGYWNLFRFDPRLKEQGKNPFILDSKEPSLDYRDFLMSEVRYAALAKVSPERAEKLFNEASIIAKQDYESLKSRASSN